MIEIKNIFDELQSTFGRIEKENILKREKDNKQFTDLLHFLLNPFIVTGVGKKKFSKFKSHYTTESLKFENIFAVIKFLKLNNTGSDETVKQIANWINHQNSYIQEFYRSLITKDLKVGVQASTVNKVYGKSFVPDFKVQLAKKFQEEVHKINGKEFVLTEKLDGMRCVLIVEDGTVKAFSRQGQSILELVDIFIEAKQLLNGVYDGELLIASADGFKDRDVLQETLKISRKDGEKKNLIFHVFDFLTIDEFQNGKSEFAYPARRKVFETIIGNRFKWIQYLPVLYQGKDLDVIPCLLKELEQQGKEGLMLNICNSYYETKRTSTLLKIKTMQTFDGMVIGFEEGDGKYQGVLGKVIIDYKGFILGCGSGFTDEDRIEIWNNKDKYINKIAEIQYFRESKNQNGELSVSFPIFKMWRFDKDEPSFY
jgi:DNA ligase-1